MEFLEISAARGPSGGTPKDIMLGAPLLAILSREGDCKLVV